MPHEVKRHVMLCDMSHITCFKIRFEVAKLQPKTQSPPLHRVADCQPRGCPWGWQALGRVGRPGPSQQATNPYRGCQRAPPTSAPGCPRATSPLARVTGFIFNFNFNFFCSFILHFFLEFLLHFFIKKLF
jgi:hypothetical protein